MEILDPIPKRKDGYLPKQSKCTALLCEAPKCSRFDADEVTFHWAKIAGVVCLCPEHKKDEESSIKAIMLSMKGL